MDRSESDEGGGVMSPVWMIEGSREKLDPVERAELGRAPLLGSGGGGSRTRGERPPARILDAATGPASLPPAAPDLRGSVAGTTRRRAGRRAVACPAPEPRSTLPRVTEPQGGTIRVRQVGIAALWRVRGAGTRDGHGERRDRRERQLRDRRSRGLEDGLLRPRRVGHPYAPQSTGRFSRSTAGPVLGVRERPGRARARGSSRRW